MRVARPIIDPSSFCEFFMDYAKENDITGELVDLGCGNGRDTLHLATRFDVVGVDEWIDTPSQQFFEGNVLDNKFLWSIAEVVYSRFFLHCLSQEQILEIIENTSNYFVAETRIVGDVPVLYTDHPRFFVDFEWLKKALQDKGFMLLYEDSGRGLAVLGEEDPLVGRVIAKKESYE